jgi:hypothetical protein
MAVNAALDAQYTYFNIRVQRYRSNDIDALKSTRTRGAHEYQHFRQIACERAYAHALLQTLIASLHGHQ